MGIVIIDEFVHSSFELCAPYLFLLLFEVILFATSITVPIGTFKV